MRSLTLWAGLKNSSRGDGGRRWLARQPVQFDQWGVADQFGYVVPAMRMVFLPRNWALVYLSILERTRSRPNAQFCMKKRSITDEEEPAGWLAGATRQWGRALEPADFFEQGGGGAQVLEGDRYARAAAAGEGFQCADDALRCPIAAC